MDQEEIDPQRVDIIKDWETLAEGLTLENFQLINSPDQDTDKKQTAKIVVPENLEGVIDRLIKFVGLEMEQASRADAILRGDETREVDAEFSTSGHRRLVAILGGFFSLSLDKHSFDQAFSILGSILRKDSLTSEDLKSFFEEYERIMGEKDVFQNLIRPNQETHENPRFVVVNQQGNLLFSSAPNLIPEE